MSEEQASQSLDAPEQDPATEALFQSFGMSSKPASKEVEFPVIEEPSDDPAIGQEETEEPAPERKKVTVKYNKEDVEIDEDQIPELLQKGLSLDKERQRKSAYEKDLDRVAKLQGFKDHSDLIANLDRLEQEAQQQKEQQWQDLRQQIKEEAEYNGIDPAKLDEWLDNHPLLQQAQQAIQERQQLEQQQQHQSAEQKWQQSWKDLYAAYPELATQSEGAPEWLTPEMQARIDRGYDPKDAYELSHRDTIKRQTEQKLLKQQRLGDRSLIESSNNTPPDEPSLLPETAALAEMMGVSPKGVREQQKYIQSRR